MTTVTEPPTENLSLITNSYVAVGLQCILLVNYLTSPTAALTKITMQEKPALKTENFLPVFIVLAYQFSSLHDQGITGEHQHIALSFKRC